MSAERRRGGGHDGAGALRWLLTYSDMITLLLALFVILFAMAETQLVHYQQVARALASAFDRRSLLGQAPGPSFVQGTSGRREAQQLSTLAARLQAAVNRAGLQREVHIYQTVAGVDVSVAADLLFPTASARLTPPATALLGQVGRILESVPNPVLVVGNTDSRPIRTARYPSNWQLAALRAANVTQVLADTPGFAPTRLLQAGWGRWAPVASNATPAGRAQNRRVDIVVLTRAVGTVVRGAANPRGIPVQPEAPAPGRGGGGA